MVEEMNGKIKQAIETLVAAGIIQAGEDSADEIIRAILSDPDSVKVKVEIRVHAAFHRITVQVNCSAE